MIRILLAILILTMFFRTALHLKRMNYEVSHKASYLEYIDPCKKYEKYNDATEEGIYNYRKLTAKCEK